MADKFYTENHLLAAVTRQLMSWIHSIFEINIHWVQVKKCLHELGPIEELHDALDIIEKDIAIQRYLIDEGYNIAIKAQEFFKNRGYGPTWKHANKVRYSMARRNIIIYP